MRVPSYDDLTPSIPDVHPRDTFDQVTRLVPSDDPVVARQPLADTHGDGLFACLTGHRPAALVALARDFSPRIERHGDTCVILDVAGLGRLLGDAHGIASELLRTAVERGIKGTIGVAPTQTAARLLATANTEVTVVTGDVAAAVAPLPLETLAALATGHTGNTGFLATGDTGNTGFQATGHTGNTGINATGDTGNTGIQATENTEDTGSGKTSVPRVPSGLRTSVPGVPSGPSGLRVFDILRRWGIRTVGEFAALPPGEVSSRFGQAGVAVQRLARGIDPRPLIPDPGVPRFIETMELEWPIEELEPLSFVFARLLEPLSAALERADKAGAAIRADLRLVDRTVHTRRLQLPAPIRDPRVLRTLLLLDLESHPPSAGIDVVTIEVDPAPSRIVQFSLLERATPSPETVATLTARLNALVGEDRCGSPVLLDTHRPDAFEMQRFNPTESRTKNREPRTKNREPRTKNQEPQPGTGNLEPGTGGALIMRRFRPAVAIRVAVDKGRPAHIAIDRKGMPGGRVEQAAGPWRSSGAWWDGSGTYWDRDEWDVSLSDGSVCRIYRDRTADRWFIDGVVD